MSTDAIAAALALAADWRSAETEQQSHAFARACDLAMAAMQAAAAATQQPISQLEAGLAELAGVAQLLTEAITTPTGRPCGPTELESNE